MTTIRLSAACEHKLLRLPALYRQLDNWPATEESLIAPSARQRFRTLSKALELYFTGHSTTEIEEATGIKRSAFVKIFGRCLELHPDGKIWGFRALVKGVRVRKLKRNAPIKAHAKPTAGYMGAMTKLMEDHPTLAADLAYALTTARKLGPSLNRYNMRWAHKTFLQLLKDRKVQPDEYPFNTKELARRTFSDWMKKCFLPLHARAWVRAEQGDSAGQAVDYQSGDGSSTAPLVPYKVWQLDEVTIDLALRHEIPNGRGDWDDLDLARTGGILCIESGVSAVLSWRLVLAAQATVEDVLGVIWDAINGPPKPASEVPNLDYLEGAGFPANVIPTLRFAIPQVFELDNALSHLAGPLQEALAGTCGVVVRMGRPKTPQARAHVESQFKLMAQRVLHQLPGTTGSGPHDPVRKKAAVKVTHRVRTPDLEHVLHVYLANQNATPSAGAGYVPVLERLRRQLEAGAFKPTYLPVSKRRAHFFNGIYPVNVKNDLKNRRLPYINFRGVRYSSEALQRHYVPNTRLWVRFDPRDLRVLLAFQTDGSEFGTLTAMGKWGLFPHDVRIRKLFLRLKREGELGERPEDEPLEALFAHLRAGAPRDRKKGLQLAYLIDFMSKHSDQLEQGAWNQAKQAVQDAVAMGEFDSLALGTPGPMASRPRSQAAANEVPISSTVALNLPRRIQRG
ncbi:hypothetical protein ACVNIS_11190 [Sphaerotilaceae bacterium SBD11-9]